MSTKAPRAALITGAGRNIGRAVAIGLARDGLDVIINGSTDRAAAEAVASEARAVGAQALVAMGDVGSREECARDAREGSDHRPAAADLGRRLDELQRRFDDDRRPVEEERRRPDRDRR
jgi:NAD(P)-dependent dehydrogenase (short-subunit alcohol dehydrogenase family)